MRTKKKQRNLRSNKSVHKRIKNKRKNNRTVKKRNNIKKRNTTIRKEHNSITHSGGTYKLLGGGEDEQVIIQLFLGAEGYTTRGCIFTKLFIQLLSILTNIYVEFINKAITIFMESKKELIKKELIKKYKIFDIVQNFASKHGNTSQSIREWFMGKNLLEIMEDADIKAIMKELDNKRYKRGKSDRFKLNRTSRTSRTERQKFEEDSLDFQSVIDMNNICKNIKHKAKKLVKFYGGKNVITRRRQTQNDISEVGQKERETKLTSTKVDKSDLVCCCMLFDGLLHATATATARMDVVEPPKKRDMSETDVRDKETLYTSILLNSNDEQILNNLMEIMTNFFINITDKSFDSNKSFITVSKLIRFLKTIGKSTLKLLGNIVGFTKLPINMVITFIDLLKSLSSIFKLLESVKIPLEGFNEFLESIEGITDDVSFLSYGMEQHVKQELEGRMEGLTTYPPGESKRETKGGSAGAERLSKETQVAADIAIVERLTEYLDGSLQLYNSKKPKLKTIKGYIVKIIDNTNFKQSEIKKYLRTFVTCLDFVIDGNYVGLLGGITEVRQLANGLVVETLDNLEGLKEVIYEHLDKLEGIHHKNQQYTGEEVRKMDEANIGDDRYKLYYLKMLNIMIQSSENIIDHKDELYDLFSFQQLYLMKKFVKHNGQEFDLKLPVKMGKNFEQLSMAVNGFKLAHTYALLVKELKVQGTEQMVKSYNLMNLVKIPRRDTVIEGIMEKLSNAPNIEGDKFEKVDGGDDVDKEAIKSNVNQQIDLLIGSHQNKRLLLLYLQTLINDLIDQGSKDIHIILHGILPLYFQKKGDVKIETIINILAAFSITKDDIFTALEKDVSKENPLKILKDLNKVQFYEKIKALHIQTPQSDKDYKEFTEALDLMIKREKLVKGGYLQLGGAKKDMSQQETSVAREGKEEEENDIKYLISSLNTLRKFTDNFDMLTGSYNSCCTTENPTSIIKKFTKELEGSGYTEIDNSRLKILNLFLTEGTEYNDFLAKNFTHSPLINLLKYLKDVIDNLMELTPFAGQLIDFYNYVASGGINKEELLDVLGKYAVGTIPGDLDSFLGSLDNGNPYVKTLKELLTKADAFWKAEQGNPERAFDRYEAEIKTLLEKCVSNDTFEQYSSLKDLKKLIDSELLDRGKTYELKKIYVCVRLLEFIFNSSTSNQGKITMEDYKISISELLIELGIDDEQFEKDLFTKFPQLEILKFKKEIETFLQMRSESPDRLDDSGMGFQGLYSRSSDSDVVLASPVVISETPLDAKLQDDTTTTAPSPVPVPLEQGKSGPQEGRVLRINTEDYITEYIKKNIQQLEDKKTKSPKGLESIIDELLYKLKMKYFEVAYNYTESETVEDSDIITELMVQLMRIMNDIIIKYIGYINDKKGELEEKALSRDEEIRGRRKRSRQDRSPDETVKSTGDSTDDDTPFHTILRYLYAKQNELRSDSPDLDLTALSAVPKIFSNFSGLFGLFSRNKETLRELIQDAQDNELIMGKIKEMMQKLDVEMTVEPLSTAGESVTDVSPEVKEDAKQLLLKIATKIDAKVDLS